MKVANKSKHRRGGRPKKKLHRSRVNITLDPHVRRRADQIAFDSQRSLSGLVELCLRRMITQVDQGSAVQTKHSDNG